MLSGEDVCVAKPLLQASLLKAGPVGLQALASAETLSGRLEEGGLQYTRGARALSNKIPVNGTRAPSYQPHCILLQSAQRFGAQYVY